MKLKKQTYDKAKHILQAHVIDGEGLIKTFFPKHWSSEKVAGKIIEALKNINDVETRGGRFVLTGITSEGIKIEIIVKSCGKLITAYPIF